MSAPATPSAMTVTSGSDGVEPGAGREPHTSIPGTAPSGSTADDPFPTVVLVSGEGGPNGEVDTAIVVACAESKTKESGDARACADLLDRGSMVSPIKDGNGVELGKRFGAYCLAGPTVEGPTQDAFAITLPQSPYGRFLIYPASRRHDVKLSSTSLTIESGTRADIGKVMASAFRNAKVHGEPYRPSGEPIVHDVLQTDVDGDGLQDTLYSVEMPTPPESLTFFSAIVGELTTKRGPLVPLLVDESGHTEVLGGLDLNKDGTDELLVVTGTHESGAAYVAKYSESKIKPIGGWSCGL